MKLIKINTDRYIIVDNVEIKEGDWVYCTERKLFGKVEEIQLAKYTIDSSMLYFEIDDKEIWCKLSNCQKITHSNIGYLYQDSILPLSLQEVKESFCRLDETEWDVTFVDGKLKLL